MDHTPRALMGALLGPAVVAGATLAAGAAAAHVAADPGVAVAGSYQAVRFRVGHGCTETATTTAIRIEVPDAVISVKAQPKPGWTLRLDRAPDATGRVTAVTWRGVLPPDQFDEFALFLRLPGQAGTLYFPAVQTCGSDEARWTEPPAPDGTRRQHPVPALRLTPAATPTTPAAPDQAPPQAAPDAGHHH